MGKSGKTKASKANSKAEAKAAKKAKLASKAERKESKKAIAPRDSGTAKTGKGKGKAKAKPTAAEEEEDLIQTLEEYRKRWETEHKTTEETADIPSRRANASLTACPVNSNQLWLYGGEFFDGTNCYFYPELFRYNTEKNEWKKLSSPTQPSPRSAHQIVASPAGGGKLWLFGGEYASPSGTSFHHFRDLWAFDIASKAWERYDTKVRPSARSGHRMALWKHYIVLFGGFHDTGIRTTYLQDLWIWDTQEYRWHEVLIRDVDRRPGARSGFSFLPCPEGVIIHGGFCKEYQGKQVKGVSLDDTWLLKMDLDYQKIKWERRKKVGYAPSPRSGVQMAYWSAKSIGISFGGVFDTYDPGEEEDLSSVFFNELFGYQTAGNGRWISLNLKKKPGSKKKNGAGASKAKKAKMEAARQRELEAEQRRKQEEEEDRTGLDDEADADEDDCDYEYKEDGMSSEEEDADEPSQAKRQGKDERVLPPPTQQSAQDGIAGKTFGSLSNPDSTDDNPQSAKPVHTKEFEVEEDEDDPDDPQKSVPIPRYNAMMAVQRNILYIYGGIVEAQNREYTLDDFYSLALDKLDRFNCLQQCNIAELDWNESDSEDDESGDSDSDSESDSDSDSESEGSDDDDASSKRDKVKKEKDAVPEVQEEQNGEDAEEENLDEEERIVAALRKEAAAFLNTSTSADRSEEDKLSTPLPGETLRTFYDRTREFWAAKAHEVSANRGKSLRRDGFQMAEEKYDTYKPILQEIEKIQAEAGLEEEDVKSGGQARAAGLGVDSRNRR